MDIPSQGVGFAKLSDFPSCLKAHHYRTNSRYLSAELLEVHHKLNWMGRSKYVYHPQWKLQSTITTDGFAQYA
jgi:hypothetical protein